MSHDLSDILDAHYRLLTKGKDNEVQDHVRKILATLAETKLKRVRAQWIGGMSFIPFVGLLIWHGINPSIPLFWSSFVGFAISIYGIASFSKMTRLALREAFQEYKEYLFLFPLFLSMTLLQKSGFFGGMSALLRHGIEKLGTSIIALFQFTGACFLSALLDNNVVADFASRALRGLQVGTLHLFSMAQIAGYAAGGCWTHIGSAQSVVAYAFIHKEIDEHYTPVQWIKAMTPVIVEIFILMFVIICGESILLRILQ